MNEAECLAELKKDRQITINFWQSQIATAESYAQEHTMYLAMYEQELKKLHFWQFRRKKELPKLIEQRKDFRKSWLDERDSMKKHLENDLKSYAELTS